MHADWLAASAYQMTERLITCINDLLVGLKLRVRGITSLQHVNQRMEKARLELDITFGLIEQLAAQDSLCTAQTVTGATPALCSLARQVVPGSRQGTLRSRVQIESLQDIRQLLFSNNATEQRELIEYLSNLRAIVEQQLEPNVKQIMGQL